LNSRTACIHLTPIFSFLARPRRFGKSLLVSTLYEIFSGNKELFKGLWIEDKIDWKSYPVILIDFLWARYEGKKRNNLPGTIIF
jgi:hypothetical protein